MLQKVFNAFGLNENINKAVPFGSGLINHTWKIKNGNSVFILQRINDQVFKNPGAIAYNVEITGKYLQQLYPDYLFVMPLKSIYKEDIFFDEAYIKKQCNRQNVLIHYYLSNERVFTNRIELI